MSGYRLIHRSLWDSDDFRDQKFSEREAFIWLCAHAAHTAHSRRVGARQVSVQRGELAVTLRSLARIWQWSEPGVRRFLRGLEKRRTLEIKSDAGVTQLSICNFDKFQAPEKKPDAEVTHGVTHTKNTGLKNTVVGGARKARATSIPDDWSVSEKGYEFARSKGLSDEAIGRNTERFANWCRAKGQTYKDWEAAWRNWVLRSDEANGNVRRGSPQQRHRDPVLAEVERIKAEGIRGGLDGGRHGPPGNPAPDLGSGGGQVGSAEGTVIDLFSDGSGGFGSGASGPDGNVGRAAGQGRNNDPGIRGKADGLSALDRFRSGPRLV